MVVGLTLALIASVPVTTCIGIHTEREMADARMQLEAKREAGQVRRERDLVYLQQALNADGTPAARASVLEHLNDAEDPAIASWAREELARTNGEANARERVCKERARQCSDGCVASPATSAPAPGDRAPDQPGSGQAGVCVRRCLETAWDECARQAIAQRQVALRQEAQAAPTAPPQHDPVAATEPPARPAVVHSEPVVPRAEGATPRSSPRTASSATAVVPPRSGPGTVDFGL